MSQELDRVIRPATADDLDRIREIEAAAGQVFRGLDMAAIADDEVPSVDAFGAYQRAGLAWVATDAGYSAIGFVIVKAVDGLPHVEQVSVHPQWARQGVGRRLLDEVEEWAGAGGASAMTLTTFRDVPWNGPYYVRLGWRPLADFELTPELAAIRKHERQQGYDRWPRMAMRRELP